MIDQICDHGERVGVSPVQVLQHDHHRCATAEPSEDAQQRLAHDGCRLAPHRHAVFDAPMRYELGHGRQIRIQARPASRSGDVTRGRKHRFGQRAERGPFVDWRAAPQRHHGSGRGSSGGHLCHEPGLADASLAGDGQPSAMTVPSIDDRLCHLSDLSRATDEFRAAHLLIVAQPVPAAWQAIPRDHLVAAGDVATFTAPVEIWSSRVGNRPEMTKFWSWSGAGGAEEGEDCLAGFVGERANFVVGAVLDGMGHEHMRGVEADRGALADGGIGELGGRHEHARDAPGFEIGDVVHTARRARASVGECLDHDVALHGDFVAEVDRCRLGERRLPVSGDPQSAALQ